MSDGKCNVMMETIFSNVYKKVNLTLLNRLLHLILNHNLAYYITAKNNMMLTYKDMVHTDVFGLFCGLRFSSFVFQYYSCVLDPGPPQIPNNFLQYRDSATETRHPKSLYSHYVDCLHIIFRFSTDEARSPIQCYLSANSHPTMSLDTTISTVGLGIVACISSSMMSTSEERPSGTSRTACHSHSPP